MAAGWFFLTVSCAPVQKICEETDLTVIFEYRGNAEQVCVAGDFNGWDARSHCMRYNGQFWETEIALEPGRYAYALVLNKKKYVPDPEALLTEDDGFGNINSVLEVAPVNIDCSGP